jgi:hypothetical protein
MGHHDSDNLESSPNIDEDYQKVPVIKEIKKQNYKMEDLKDDVHLN